MPAQDQATRSVTSASTGIDRPRSTSLAPPLGGVICVLTLLCAPTTIRAQLADACPGTDLGILTHPGGTITADTTGLANDFGEGSDAATFAPNSTLSVLRRGEAWVLTEDAVTKGADAFVRIANAVGADPLGLFRIDVDGGDAIAMTGARFASTTTGRGLVKVRINRP